MMLEHLPMDTLRDLIHFRPGPQGATSYYFLREEGHKNPSARLTLIGLGQISKRLLPQDPQRPTPDTRQVLLAMLPSTFLDHLEQAQIEVEDAWAYMALHRASQRESRRMVRAKARASSHRDQAERLARILATVAGGKMAPEDLFQELLGLMNEHGPEAIEVLRHWAQAYGFSKKGQYVIVENRANKSRRLKAR
jgi:hypothetical protein